MNLWIAGRAILAGAILAAGAAAWLRAATNESGRAAIPDGPVWLTSFAQAKAQALARHVPILVDFSGSDWCGWCMKLDKEVFAEKAFKGYAAKDVVLLLVDFPRRTPQSEELAKQNQLLAEQYGVEGFPTVLLLDAAGKEMGRTGYRPGGVESYIRHLKALSAKP